MNRKIHKLSMSNDGIELDELLERFDADPQVQKHARVESKLSEIHEQLDFLTDQFQYE